MRASTNPNFPLFCPDCCISYAEVNNFKLIFYIRRADAHVVGVGVVDVIASGDPQRIHLQGAEVHVKMAAAVGDTDT